MATPKCCYRKSSGYPPNNLELCAYCNSNCLYHTCQVSYEFNNDYDFPMTKKYYSCLSVAIGEYNKDRNKEKNKNSSGVASIPPRVRDLVVVPTNTSVAPQNDDIEADSILTNVAPTNTSVALHNDAMIADSIPTNVAPERDNFVSPGDIHIDMGLHTEWVQ